MTASISKQPKFIRINNDLKLIKGYALHLYGIKVGRCSKPSWCHYKCRFVYVCVCVSICLCVRVCVHVHLHDCIDMVVYVCMYIACVYAGVQYVCVCVRIFMYGFVHMCMLYVCC